MIKGIVEFMFNPWLAGFLWGVVFGRTVFPIMLELIAK